MNRLKQYRERYGLTQPEAVAEIRRRAVARGDLVEPGLDRPALSKHENGHKRPGPYYRALYSEVYGATPAELGFCVALPGESGHHEDVDRREFLTGAAGFMVTLALPAPTRLGDADVVSLRESVVHFYKLDHLHGSGSVYSATAQTFQRLRSLVEHASYGQATGRTLRELAAETAQHAGWVAFDADRHDDAQRWWLEAMKWSRLAESDSVGVTTMARMAVQASWQDRPRETIDLATAAQRAGVMTPRLTSWLLACEAVGHAGVGDAASAHAALRRARTLADRPRHDDDPRSLDHYGPAAFTFHEQRVALLLGDLSAAEDRARTMLALGDPVAYPRNHTLYLIRLANALAQRRKIDEGAAAVKQATVAAAGLSSPRVTRELRTVTQSLAAAA